MSAIDDVKAKGLPYHDDESGLIRLSILELDARVKQHFEYWSGHIDELYNRTRDIKVDPVLNDAKVPVCDQVKEFYERKKMLNDAKPTKEEHYDILHEGLKHMAGIDAKPTPTDELTPNSADYSICNRAFTRNTPTDDELVKPSYNAETIEAMEDVKEGKNIITIPLDELFEEDCGKEVKSTDEELTERAFNKIKQLLPQNMQHQLSYCDCFDILLQLIDEARS